MSIFKKVVFTTLFVCFSINAFAIDKSSCSKFQTLSTGEKKCIYNGKNAAKYAAEYHKEAKQENSPFGYYTYNEGGNCTNFASQSILAGFTKSQDMDAVYNYRTEFQADRNEPMPWYHDTKWAKSPSWAGANDLYKYAKGNKETTPPFKYSGVMFEFVTRDYISTYKSDGKTRNPNNGFLEVEKIKPGDIIFMDYANSSGITYYDMYHKNGIPRHLIKTDGVIDHSMIVTKVGFYPRSYEDIIVASATAHYNDPLSDVNNREGLGNLVEFHVYRPVMYIEK